MDIVTLGAALSGSAEYVNSHFKGGSNIQIVDNPDGTQTINASGEVSAEDTVARAEIAAIKDGETLDSFGDVETALGDKADATITYTKTEVDTALDNKVDKVSGKGLSTNDYTTAEKTKLAGIAEGAEVNEIEGIKVNGSTVNPDANKVVNITVPTTAADVLALPNTTKYAAALSLTINSSTYVMTGQLKDQNGDNLGTAQTIDLPLESVVVGGSYNSQTKKVVLTLQNGNTIEFSVADLVSGLQTELSASNKLNPAYIDYDSAHAAVTEAQREQIETNKNNISINKNELIKLVDSGDKNIINNLLADGSQSGGVTATVSEDKQVTLSGSTTSLDAVFATSTNVFIPAGTYIGSGCPSGGATDKYRIDYVINDSTVYRDTGSGVEFTVNDGDVIRSQIVVYRGSTAPSAAFALMVCLKSAYTVSPTYQPHKGYDIINGRRVYVADTAPTGTIPTGAIWIGG